MQSYLSFTKISRKIVFVVTENLRTSVSANLRKSTGTDLKLRKTQVEATLSGDTKPESFQAM